MRASLLELATLALFLTGTGFLFAQETSDPSSISSSNTVTSLTSDQMVSQLYIPLTLSQKYLYTFDKVASPGALFGMGVHALIDDAMNMPHQWGTESGSLGLRVASTFGVSFLRENIAFGVRAFDHEDPRYFRSGKGNRLARVRYAAIHTFLVRSDNGSTMPAYSMFVAHATMPFLAQSWRPEPFSVGRGFRGIGVGFSTAVASNVFNEFWPDIRAKLPRKLGGGKVRTTWFSQDYLTPASSQH